jgi:hypothetical protein
MTATALPPKSTASGFRATRKGKGPLTIHNVPIFVETEKTVGKGDERAVKQFGQDWINQAVAKAKREAAEGYHPPLHVWHHGENKQAIAAGHFKVLGAEQIQFGGQTRMAVMADLVLTNPAVEADVIASRLPYRSVEIHKLDVASIDSLALLDDEVPHCRLPMLEVGEVSEAAGSGVEVFRAGARTAIRFAFEPDEKKTPAIDEQKSPQASADGDSAKGEDPVKEVDPEAKADESAKDASPGVQGVLAAIADGTISVGDFQALVDAITAKTASGDPAGNADLKKPAQAPAPGGSMHSDSSEATNMSAQAPKAAEKMTADSETAVQMAAMQGEIAGLKATVAAQQADTQRKQAVAAAMKRLEGRVLGSTFEEEITAFHAKWGGEAFNAYVAGFEKVMPPLAGGDPTRPTNGSKVPAVAMKYQAEGSDAIDRAAKFAAEWEQQAGHGISSTQEEYVAFHMKRSQPAARGN